MKDAAQQLIDAAYATRKAGDLPAALQGYQAAVTALRQIDAQLRLAHAIRHIADIQRHLHQLATAQQNYAEALTLYRTNSDTNPLDLANTLRGYALLMEDLADPATARTMWQEARDLYAATSIQAGVDEATRRIATLTAP